MADFPGMPQTHWDNNEKQENNSESKRDGRGSILDKNPKTMNNLSGKEKSAQDRKNKAGRQDKKRKNGRSVTSPSYAEVAHHEPGEDNVAINDAPEGETVSSDHEQV
jgi:hypothetical protein